MEVEELTEIYRKRGLTTDFARQVAEQLMAADALGAHARDELHISDLTAARPLQAALASAATFSIGATAPMLTVLVAPQTAIAFAVACVSILCLAVLGMLGAKAGGAPVMRSVVRVTFWGVLAMALTAGIGAMVGTAV
jgi:VIT1/CCC1 family predicted Fe2+/Mn2+ transporter